MGAPDGAEVCELIGVFLLNLMKTEFPELDIGLYRDDGLAVYPRMPGPKLCSLEKRMHAFFNKHGLKCTIETNLKVSNFLDVTLNLTNDSFAPFKKPNDNPLYVHTHSNHPPNVIRQIPISVNQRLSCISSDKHSFDSIKETYQKALNDSGHKHILEHKSNAYQSNPGNKSSFKKKREIVWFNPPYNSRVRTNIGKEFLKLIDKHFPPNHTLRSCVNRNSVKLSYSCMKNIKQIIQSHNNKILQRCNSVEKKCNCRETCVMGGECCTGPIVYKATTHKISPEDKLVENKTYIGSTQEFKTRLGNHKASFSNVDRKNETALSTHVWDENLGSKPIIKWEVVKKSFIYNKGGRYCDLCLSEALVIADHIKNKNCLNKRTELKIKCAHILRHRLSKLKKRN